jgi:hypothetical protein
MTSVLQPWVQDLSLMMQSVLLGAIRGPDGVPKYSSAKNVVRWYRRCVLLSAFDKIALTDPLDRRGGSFTGPSIENAGFIVRPSLETPIFVDRRGFTSRVALPTWWMPMTEVLDEYMRGLDGMPMHFHNHLTSAFEIVGYEHPDLVISNWFRIAYERFVRDTHATPETKDEMRFRLGDSRENWMKTADQATLA